MLKTIKNLLLRCWPFSYSAIEMLAEDNQRLCDRNRELADEAWNLKAMLHQQRGLIETHQKRMVMLRDAAGVEHHDPVDIVDVVRALRAEIRLLREKHAEG